MTIYVPKVPTLPISSLVGTVDSSFPVHLCIIDIIDTLVRPNQKKYKVITKNLLPYSDFLAKFLWWV